MYSPTSNDSENEIIENDGITPGKPESERFSENLNNDIAVNAVMMDDVLDHMSTPGGEPAPLMPVESASISNEEYPQPDPYSKINRDRDRGNSGRYDISPCARM